MFSEFDLLLLYLTGIPALSFLGTLNAKEIDFKPSELKTFNFFTSSIPANYKATISGITSRGDVIYKSFTFKSK